MTTGDGRLSGGGMPSSHMRITALAGGVGAAKFITGLSRLIPHEDLTIIVNTGDDFRWMGLYVCPDLDTIIYTLAGLANPDTGWGVAGDTFTALNRLHELGCDPWFQIGDRDLATHLFRTERLTSGWSLSEVTSRLCAQNKIRIRIIPMADGPVPTLVHTNEGILDFQDYFVRRRCVPSVKGISFHGIEHARPAPGLLQSLRAADAVIVCPSNPFISIGPILGVPGIRSVLKESSATVLAISPVIGGKAVKGPTAAMLSQLGHDVSAAGVAALYEDFLDIFIVDREDEALAPRIASRGLEVRTAPTLMDTLASKVELARRTIEGLREVTCK